MQAKKVVKAKVWVNGFMDIEFLVDESVLARNKPLWFIADEYARADLNNIDQLYDLDFSTTWVEDVTEDDNDLLQTVTK